jgi:glycosyltransferase involved in cell wall biosynthesis
MFSETVRNMRIAFLTGTAYHLLIDGESSEVGGSQIQQVYLGKELAERGHDVFFIEEESAEKEPQSVKNVEVCIRKQPNTSNRILQISSWISNSYKVLNRINPDIVYARVLSFDLIPLLIASRLTSSKLVYCFANDSEATSDPEIFKSSITNSRFYKSIIGRTLSSVDLLIAQNKLQRRSAIRRFSTEIAQIPNGYPIAQVCSQSGLFSCIERPVILWVGNIRGVKDPFSFLDLAASLPEYYFVMVGGKRNREAELYDEVVARTKEITNIRFEGFIPQTEINEYYARANVFVNTSKSEGFPNTFLESWAHGVPVASLNSDPDGLIRENGLGIVSDGNIESLATGLRNLVAAQRESRELSAKCKDFVEENFSIKSVTNQYEKEFLSLLDD